jgi:hypothetical protein
MIVGMVPMALALEKGSQMQAPLGRAVIGGLLVSTFATLLILPAIFALLMGERKFQSPSLSPDDPESKLHAPEESQASEEGDHQEQGATPQEGNSQRDPNRHPEEENRPGQDSRVTHHPNQDHPQDAGEHS